MTILQFNQYYIAKEIKDSNNKSYKENQQKLDVDKPQIYDYNWEKYLRIIDSIKYDVDYFGNITTWTNTKSGEKFHIIDDL